MPPAGPRLRAMAALHVPSCPSDWVLALLSLSAWAAFAAAGTWEGFPSLCTDGSLLGGMDSTWQAAVATGAVQAYALHWAVMVVAMMFPLLPGAVRFVAYRSLRWRRGRAVAGFLAGYLAVWMGAGAVWAAAVLAAQPAGAGSLAPVLAATALAILWQASPWRTAALRRRHAMRPLAPTGLRADLSCIGAGLRHGTACLATCGPIMAAVMLAPPTMVLPLALGATALLSWERTGAPMAV